ncbi:MAG: hypothetical protein HWD60_09280 [Defluviicoccus sp.]|nr:MAG: hypothetical protein HWD60_09280 [Defluviicoccus sp.]
MRYALAPDGILSPAALLALWTCAAKSFIHRPPGCAEGGFLDKQDIFNAARAAAIADVARECGALKGRLGDTRSWRGACKQAAFDHAAQAGWAPDVAQNCQGKACVSQVDAAIRLLATYATAKRDGHFEGSMAALHCFEDNGPAPGRNFVLTLSASTTIASVR